MARIAVYITGSIAAYKAVEVVRALQHRGHDVRVIETKSAQQLVGAATLASLTKHPVMTDLWQPSRNGQVPHIELADWTQLAVVVPASADFIAKMANGLADDPASTTLLATAAPKMVFPAMNNHMLANPSTQRNLRQLVDDGVAVIEPAEGLLAEGYSGKGRLPEVPAVVEQIQEKAEQLLHHGELADTNFVITVGGTQEPLDPVRFIGNRSSGKMGVAIARAALSYGAKVTLIAGNVSVSLPKSVHCHLVRVQTTEEMARAVQNSFATADVLIMAAAVADFKPRHSASHKVKKQKGRQDYQFDLVPTEDILKMAGKMKKRQLVIGFAAETDDLLQNAQRKLEQKNADMIVANDVSKAGIGFASDDNQVTILQRDADPLNWPKQSKQAVANQLMALIINKIKEGW
ncbi:bifunctional phosphopantothenoylcysteine decarboxylase/phosphopantothenate--cysteine ligase CoaBC [Limosilactobacillus difficilis]|uniref:bifunctional phosphopantothenoylcysteine decarboxylase/phosphopantothenate--cysteine ligase CoaBC n=1 Tax=Limosilactobacillus difficilis TaxID=2991838 RepID=UPI0024BA870A|nr:bifunctional phosphopantothenoylcysteine decarboxylase/phosphopantothenate--cysteine ligase CoaBC [Limosilactobacillus difficilis]